MVQGMDGWDASNLLMIVWLGYLRGSVSYKLNVKKRSAGSGQVQPIFAEPVETGVLLPSHQRRLLMQPQVLSILLSSKPSCWSAVPIYNHDLHHFTPAFHLSTELTKSSSTGNLLSPTLTAERHKFQLKIQEEELQLDQTHPNETTISFKSSVSKYCLVCRVRFEDYWTHIAEKNHQRKLARNTYNTDIQELCLKLNPLSPAHPKSKESKPTTKKGAKGKEEGGG